MEHTSGFVLPNSGHSRDDEAYEIRNVAVPFYRTPPFRWSFYRLYGLQNAES